MTHKLKLTTELRVIEELYFNEVRPTLQNQTLVRAKDVEVFKSRYRERLEELTGRPVFAEGMAFVVEFNDDELAEMVALKLRLS